MTPPTILRLPQWFGEPEQILLPLPAAEYQVHQVHPDWWHVVARPTGQTVYTGLGPISLEAATAAPVAAPFRTAPQVQPAYPSYR